jgi:hypothetical protein
MPTGCSLPRTDFTITFKLRLRPLVGSSQYEEYSKRASIPWNNWAEDAQPVFAAEPGANPRPFSAPR